MSIRRRGVGMTGVSERALVAQASVEFDVGQLSIGMPRTGADPALDLGFAGGEFNGDHFAAGRGDFCEQFVDEALRHAVFGIEREDDDRQTVGESAAKRRPPDRLAQRDETGRAEVA